MSDQIATLLDNNRVWAERMCEEDPDVETFDLF